MTTQTSDQVTRLNSKGTTSIFEVTSGNSQKKYTVTIKPKIDDSGSMYFKRECSCPARKHCHHLDSVQQFQWDEANEHYSETGETDYFDVLEVTE